MEAISITENSENDIISRKKRSFNERSHQSTNFSFNKTRLHSVNFQSTSQTSEKFPPLEKAKVQCYRCRNYGHFANECKMNSNNNNQSCRSSRTNTQQINNHNNQTSHANSFRNSGTSFQRKNNENSRCRWTKNHEKQPSNDQTLHDIDSPQQGN